MRPVAAQIFMHGRDLMALGFTVSQVVHDYGDICQAITELAMEQNAPITTDEFKTLNGCLDTAIAEAVTEHARITADSRADPAIVGDPFQPFSERRGRDRTGLGLGLSIARRAVRAHGGDIHIHNHPGRGCVFTIDVPCADDAVPASPGWRRRVGCVARSG